jgi:hypothetical protein
VAAVQSNEVCPTPSASVRSACFGGASDKRFPFGRALPNVPQPALPEVPERRGAAQRWLEARQGDLLPVEYYHVVFTLPAPIADLAYGYRINLNTTCRSRPTAFRLSGFPALRSTTPTLR